MSAIQRSILAVVLMLAAVMGGATPAAALDCPYGCRGIWVTIGATSAWTLTVVNLTDYTLSLVSNSVEASQGQRPPFWGNTLADNPAFPLAPYRNVTWKSNTGSNDYWNGALTFLPQGMGEEWTATLNFRAETYGDTSTPNYVVGTWVYLTVDFSANPDWVDDPPYNISCSYPGWGAVGYNTMYNVMTLSGTDLVVSLYAPYIGVVQAPSVDVTLVFRQRWPHTPLSNGYQDSLVAPCLRYLDNIYRWY